MQEMQGQFTSPTRGAPNANGALRYSMVLPVQPNFVWMGLFSTQRNSILAEVKQGSYIMQCKS